MGCYPSRTLPKGISMHRLPCAVLVSLVCVLSSTRVLAAPQDAATTAPGPLTLEQVMADPDWMGPAVEDAWWAWDGRRVQYELKRDGATIRDTWQQSTESGGTAARIDGASRADLDAVNPVYDASH